MSLLTPEIGLVFWMTLSFGIVFVILAKFGFPIITKAVEKRNNYIIGSLEAAKQAEEKLATVNIQAENVIREAHGKRNALLNEAQELKAKIVNEAKQAAEIEARQRLEKASTEIEVEKKRAIVEIRHQVADISVKIAGKVVGEQLQDDTQQRQLIERLLEEEIYKG